MEIIPAIDLKDGQCVRLRQGDFDQVTTYGDDPLAVAMGFRTAGATRLHVVDLDGARDGARRQMDVIRTVSGDKTGLALQTGGGVRSAQDIRDLLAAGATRVVIGSLAVTNPAMVRGWLQDFGGDAIVLAFDVRAGQSGVFEVMTHGWQQGSALTLEAAIDLYQGTDLRHILCTDIARDGMMQGPNLDLYAMIALKWPRLSVIASGGVGGMEDLSALYAMGAPAVVVGKAIYEGRIDLAKAIAAFS